MAVAHAENRRGPRHAPASPEDGAGRVTAPAGAAPGRLPGETARELPGALLLHFHGVSAEDVAEIVRRELR